MSSNDEEQDGPRVKTQSKGPSQPSSPKPEALDEKITHLTEEVAKKHNIRRLVIDDFVRDYVERKSKKK